MVISLFLFKTLFASFIEEICWYFGVTTLISKRLNPNLGEFFSGSFEVRMDKIISSIIRIRIMLENLNLSRNYTGTCNFRKNTF